MRVGRVSANRCIYDSAYMQITRNGRPVKVIPVDARELTNVIDSANRFTEHLSAALERCKTCAPGAMCVKCFDAIRAADNLRENVKALVDGVEWISTQIQFSAVKGSA